MDNEKTKICRECHQEKPISEFYKRKQEKDGIHYDCKVCQKLKNKIYKSKDENKVKQKEYDRLYYIDHSDYHKMMTKEWLIKNPDYMEEYYLEHGDERRQYNREQYYITNKYEKNKEYYINNSAKWNAEHKDEIKQNRIKYRKDNPNYNKTYLKNRYHSDPKYKLTMSVRVKIYTFLKKDDIVRNHTSIKYLGCPVKEFKQYLENLFLPEMTWENWGPVWELDHILPCASFDLTIEENIFKCFNFSNHQPLFKTTEIAESFGYKDYIGNREKSDKI